MSPQPVAESKTETKEIKKVQPESTTQKMTIMTDLDAYISETIISQPEKPEFKVRTRGEDSGLHRMSLPEPFEKFSYDCTRGLTCQVHKWSCVYETIEIRGTMASFK